MGTGAREGSGCSLSVAPDLGVGAGGRRQGMTTEGQGWELVGREAKVNNNATKCRLE